MLKRLAAIALAVILVVSFAACGQKGNQVKKIGDVEIEVLDPAGLKNQELKKWYEESYRVRFSHSVSFVDGYKYVLVCAGEMPSTGYSVDIVNALRENGMVIFYARLIPPKEDEKTGTAVSYPHIFFRLKEKEEITVRVELDMGGAERKGENYPDRFSGINGVYIGLADNNFVEISVDKSVNFPQTSKMTVFKLSDEVRKMFEKENPEYQEFKENDPVSFDCVRTKDGQWEITKMVNLSGFIQQEEASGEYVGQIDANSVEIKIQGVPRAFRLSDPLRTYFESNEVKTGTPVTIKYVKEGESLKIVDFKVVQ
ncbi:MAG: protease complex subunit PrcB family protein [Peptococcaceae bacterium]|jgi:hypothetical protein|nr:protease complex subunit PrcB family protein [Peptococcaceae bacterium]MDH7525397.1 protease complex subunit PrcB family protein [Peptococcaceae bacterium]